MIVQCVFSFQGQALGVKCLITGSKALTLTLTANSPLFEALC